MPRVVSSTLLSAPPVLPASAGSSRMFSNAGSSLADNGSNLSDAGAALSNTGRALSDTGPALSDTGSTLPDTASSLSDTGSIIADVAPTFSDTDPTLSSGGPALSDPTPTTTPNARKTTAYRDAPSTPVTLEKSLATVAPKVAAQWHRKKNGKVTPVHVSAHAHEKYWWRCEVSADHEWEANPHVRVGNGKASGCPFCSGHRVSVTNSLATIKPAAAAFWHPVRNACSPKDVLASSSKKYWFSLPSQGAVQRSPASFKREDKREVERPYGASGLLSAIAPEVAAQWHPTRNGTLNAADIASITEVTYWWQCAASPDHEWQATPQNRVSLKTGCPCCSGRRVSITNSLATLKPLAAARFDGARNRCGPDDVTANSGIKYWFILPEKGAVQRSPRSFKR
jgi:hypothetical protein